MHASNFYLRMIGNTDDQLEAALSVALDGHTAVAWARDKDWFILYWQPIAEATELPYPLSVKSARHIIRDWLRPQTPRDSAPDIDGTVTKDGWELRSGWEALREVTKSSVRNYEILRIRPEWAVYAK